MKCTEVQKKLVDYVDRELPADVAAKVQDHLSGCEKCSASYAEIRNVHAYAVAWPEVDSVNFVPGVAAELEFHPERVDDTKHEPGRIHEQLEAARRQMAGPGRSLPPPPAPPTAVALDDSDDDDRLRERAEQQIYQARKIAGDAAGFVAASLIDNVTEAVTALEAALRDFDAVVVRRRLELLNTHLLTLSESYIGAATKPKRSFADLLFARGVITEEQLRQAREVQKTAPGDLANIIHDLGFASEREIAAARAAALGLQFVDLTRTPIEPAAIRAVPEHIVRRYNILPIKIDISTSPSKLMVAVGDIQTSLAGIDDVLLVSRCRITPVLAAKSDIEDAVSRVYGEGVPTPEAPSQPVIGTDPTKVHLLLNWPGAEPEAPDDDELDVEKMSAEAPIIRIAHAVVQQAILRMASEIQVEPREKGVRISYRLNGELQEAITVPKHVQKQLIARFKIMAGLNTAERSAVQKGRFPLRSDGREYELRVTCSPSTHGEEIVMQVRESTPERFDVNELRTPAVLTTEKPPRMGVSKKPIDTVHLDELLQMMVDGNASYLHLAAGVPPILRVDAGLVPTPYESCKPIDIQQIIYAILTDDQIRTFERRRELSLEYALLKKARFYVNVYMDNGKVAASIRLIPKKIPSVQDLNLPPVIEKLTHTRRGLILIAGARESGRTATAYAMLNHINLTRSERIHTIEDLVSFEMTSKVSLVTQQSIGVDALSYEEALSTVRRANVDVVMAGDLPTAAAVSAALQLAELGHLVIAQAPGASVRDALDMLIDRTELARDIACRTVSRVLQAVIAQRLLPRASGQGRIVVTEVLIATHDVRQSIASGNTDLRSVIEASASTGMMSMAESVTSAYRKGVITHETAMREGVDPAMPRG